MAGFVGKWKMVDSENFDNYMKAVGVGLVMRKAGASAKPTQEISVSGDEVTIKTLSTFKNTEFTYKLNAELDETTPDGRKVKTTATVDGNRLIISQKGDPDSTITRELAADGQTFTMTLEAKGVVAVRKYQKE